MGAADVGRVTVGIVTDGIVGSPNFGVVTVTSSGKITASSVTTIASVGAVVGLLGVVTEVVVDGVVLVVEDVVVEVVVGSRQRPSR